MEAEDALAQFMSQTNKKDAYKVLDSIKAAGKFEKFNSAAGLILPTSLNAMDKTKLSTGKRVKKRDGRPTSA